MCILIYHPEGSPVLKKRVYKRCFDKNPDGAGFAYWNKGVWKVTKGLMTFKAFWKTFNRMRFQPEDRVIVHFRVGTSGNRRGPDCTHPFPVTDDLEEMRQTKFENKNIVFHNGIISQGEGTASDTMCGVRDYIFPMHEFYHTSDARADILGGLIKAYKCRWIITRGPELDMFGEFAQDENYGNSWFSNAGYLPEKPKADTVGTPGVTAPTGSVNPFVGGEYTVSTQRFYRHDKLEDFLNVDGRWSWNTWKNSVGISESKSSDVVNPNEAIPYVEAPATVMGLLDNKSGDILWDDDYDAVQDLPACPSCGSESLTESGMINTSTGCKDCGCCFNIDTGEIVYYDETLTYTRDSIACTTCMDMVTIDEYGECPYCGTILDPELAERKIKEQRNGK